MAVNPEILCLNYLDCQRDIKTIINESEGKLIVIDNADVLLDDELRKQISLDDRNQYLIIGRNPKNLFATLTFSRHLVIFEIFVIAGNLINKCAVRQKFDDPVRCGLHDLMVTGRE